MTTYNQIIQLNYYALEKGIITLVAILEFA